MKPTNNIICTCGHSYTDHSYAKYPMQKEFISIQNMCYGTTSDEVGYGFYCGCQDYNADNLRYLQAKYEQKIARK